MIKITTDSTCDLPRELLERYNITVTPLGIIKAGKLYQDGVDIRTGDIAAHVDAGGEITTTNAVNVADYEELFRRLMEEYDAVIHLNIGMGFSSCHQNARLAAEELARATRSEVVQVIGTKFVLYRESHSKPREKRIQLVKTKKKSEK